MNKCLTFIFVSVLSVLWVGGGRSMSILLVSFPLIIWVTEVVDELVLVVFLSTTNVIGAITDKKNQNII